MADNYMPNPQMRRAASKFKDGGASKPKPQKPISAAARPHESMGEHASKHVIHHPGGHENPSPGKYHSEVHHADGNVEHEDHNTYDEAVEHGRPSMEDGESSEASADDVNGGFGHGEDSAVPV